MPEPRAAFTEAPTVRPVRFTGVSPGRTRFSDVASFSRSRRRRLIRRIEEQTGHVLLCYVSQGPQIVWDDVLHLHRLLEVVEPGVSIGLLLNSPGGEIDVAEKMMHVLRQTTSPPLGNHPGALDIIVPDAAKSAATLMALGADRVIMSDSSELGPIDPQLPVEENGKLSWYSAFDYIRAYETAEKRCIEHPDNAAFRFVFGTFNPLMVEAVRQAISRTHQIAFNLLNRLGRNPTEAPSKLMDTNRFPSHGQMIDWRTAKDIGLEHVQYLDSRAELWRMYWRLYGELRGAAGDKKKVFESSSISLIV